MSKIIAYEDIIERQYQKSLRTLPLSFNVYFDDVMISAINFIRKYQGDYELDLKQRLEYTLNEALTISEDLLIRDALKKDKFNLYWGQNISKKNTQEIDIILENGLLLLDINEYLNEQEFDPYYLMETVLLNYIDSFLDFFNEKHTMPIAYTSKKEVRKRAMKNNEQGLLKILSQSEKHKDFELKFIGVKDKYNTSNAQLIKF